MRNECQICGAIIGDNNHTGVGGGCMMNVVQPSKKDTFFKFGYLDVYIEQAKIWREVFLEQFKNTKFRSEFKKSFYESIKTNDRLSKKQLEIIKTNISYKDLYLYNETEKKTKDVYNTSFRVYQPTNDEEVKFYFEKIDLYKKSYLSGRKKIKIEE